MSISEMPVLPKILDGDSRRLLAVRGGEKDYLSRPLFLNASRPVQHDFIISTNCIKVEAVWRGPRTYREWMAHDRLLRGMPRLRPEPSNVCRSPHTLLKTALHIPAKWCTFPPFFGSLWTVFACIWLAYLGYERHGASKLVQPHFGNILGVYDDLPAV